MSLDWVALWITAVACGGVYALKFLLAQTGFDAIPGASFLPFLPGVLFGMYRFLTVYSPARVPFVTLTLLLFGGLLWTNPNGFGEGFSIINILLICMSISVLFNTRQRWLFGAKWFSIGALVSSFPLLWNWMTTHHARLGEAHVNSVRITDPNSVGVLYTMAVLVQLTILWNYRNLENPRAWIRYALSGWFLIIIILTASRGALVTLVLAVVVFLFLGKRRTNRRVLLLSGSALVAAVGAYWALNGASNILSRFTAADVGTLNGRTILWQVALDQMSNWSIPKALLGEGTGSAKYTLGEFAPELGRMLGDLSFRGSEAGVPRVSAHSSYVDWVLMYGAVGMFIGAVLLVNSLINSWRLDRTAPGAAASAFMTVFLLTAATTVIHFMGTEAIACSGIALGYIYMNLTQGTKPGPLARIPVRMHFSQSPISGQALTDSQY